MASARQKRRDKQLDQLVRENQRLHRDVEDLETAYFLHRQMQQAEEESLRGVLRREIGGSIWQHGGVGKLQTYKSSKDLGETEAKQNGNHLRKTGSHKNHLNSDSSTGSRKKTRQAESNTDEGISSLGEDSSDKIALMKTRVLQKAAAKMIKRDKWALSAGSSASEVCASTDDEQNEGRKKKESVRNHNVRNNNTPVIPTDKTVVVKSVTKNGSLKMNDEDKVSVKPGNVGKNKNMNYALDRRAPSSLSKKYDKRKESAKEKSKIDTKMPEKRPVSAVSAGMRKSRLDQYEKEKSKNSVSGLTVEMAPGRKNLSPSDVSVSVSARDKTGNVANKTTALPQNVIQQSSDTKSPDTPLSDKLLVEGDTKKIISNTESAMEIYLDSDNFEVRVKSGAPGSVKELGPSGTHVLIQPGTTESDDGSDILTCSVVGAERLQENSQKEFCHIFGAEDSPKSKYSDPVFQNMSTKLLTKNLSHVKSSTSVLVCDKEVEKWLRTLGISDVDRHVAIFAENRISMEDVENLTAVQLHEMGVLAFGVLNKILHGIKDLKNNHRHLSKSFNESANIRQKTKTQSSIAWNDDKVRDKMSERKGGGKVTSRSCQDISSHDSKGKTFVKSSKGQSAIRYPSTESDKSSDRSTRPQSAVSKAGISVATYTVSRANSKLSDSQSRATKHTDAKPLGKRPPSSKSGGKISSVSSNQGKRKTEVTDHKPKGVLLRRRSSSLSREGGKFQQKNRGAESDSERVGMASRGRSRSADAVKRKALAGVHAAAKKFEEKTQRQKEREKQRNISMVIEKQKARRDKMAARHQEREKIREEAETADEELEDSSSLEDEEEDGEESESLENLVTVNVLSHPSTSARSLGKKSPTVVYILPPKKFSTNSGRSADPGQTKVTGESGRSGVTRSLRRVEPARRSQRPDFDTATNGKGKALLSTYKISPIRSKLTTEPVHRMQEPAKEANITDRSVVSINQEPDGAKETAGESQSTVLQDKVADIQLKIKRLKSRATSGDDVTLTLVRDLQMQLQEFENQLKDKEQKISPQSEHIPTPKPRNLMVTKKQLPQQPIPGGQGHIERRSSVIEELLEEEEAVVKTDSGKLETSAMSMSKKELLEEMRKEKHQHHRQIRQLQSELKRIRHADPVWSMELEYSHISYKETDLIGEGGFAQVFRGMYQGSEVAIKRLKVPLPAQDRNYFAAEVSLLRELRHPRVVLLIGVCTSERLPLMVLEYMSRGSLYNHLHDPDCEGLDHAEFYQVARDMALGMTYLHNHKPQVLHLDLKSMNVLLCHSFRAKIADFGFSKLRHEADSKMNQKSKNKQTRGSPAWMAPELLDKGEITGKADVYSFGIILWEMVTKKIPYANISIFQILEQVRKNKRPEIPASCPVSLTQLIGRCWDKNPAKRPQFQDIVLLLENLAFPPAWRELFKEAGVPEEALHNVESTRTIISLVNSTLDSRLLSSFILQQDKHTSTVESKKIGEAIHGQVRTDSLSSTRSDKTPRNDGESELSDDSLVSSQAESISMTSSVKESEDESSDLSTEDSLDSSFTAESERCGKRITNQSDTFIPALQLSGHSDTFTDSTGQPDWFSISLDDRTFRKSPTKVSNLPETSLPQLMGITSPDIAYSQRSHSVQSSVSEEQGERYVYNQSAPQKSEPSSPKLLDTVASGRTVSPKKRVSLTKKLAGRSSATFEPSARGSVTLSIDQSKVPDRFCDLNVPVKPLSARNNLSAECDSISTAFSATLKTDSRHNSSDTGSRTVTSEEEMTPRTITSPKFVPSSDEFETIEKPEKSIRVVLVPKEKIDSEKPTITPRQSKLKHGTGKAVEHGGYDTVSKIDSNTIGVTHSELQVKDTKLYNDTRMLNDGKHEKIVTVSSSSPSSVFSPQLPPPPPPPPPPVPPVFTVSSRSTASKSVQRHPVASRSMADELRLKLAARESLGLVKNSINTDPGSDTVNSGQPKFLADKGVADKTLQPQPSKGLPFMVQSVELREQKDQLRSVSKPHPNQLEDLSQVSKEKLSSIAEILKKAVLSRRLAMGEESGSMSQSVDSVSWSVDTG